MPGLRIGFAPEPLDNRLVAMRAIRRRRFPERFDQAGVLLAGVYRVKEWVFATGLTRNEAINEARRLRATGIHATIWHTGGPKTGPKSQYQVRGF